MSQYLSRFYCGNKEGKCNFSDPIKYSKVLDRQFDNLLFDIEKNCPDEKGYCCEKNQENMKKISHEDLNKINKMAGAEIYKKDNHGNFFEGQIPLVKIDKKNNDIKNISLCDCGGDTDDYLKCVKKNCKDYKIPSKYEFCKLGNSERFGCYGEEGKKCKVGEENKNEDMMYSHNVKINNLFPDCYLNKCNKRHVDGSMDLTANYSNEEQYYAYNNDTKSKFHKSIDDYLLIPSESKKEIKNIKSFLS